MDLGQIETTTVAERVRIFLRNQIIQGELKPGDRIVQNLVAQQLGVSRIPIREAIHALIAEGLLDMEPHHGAAVSPVSADMAREVFGLRATIEPRLLRMASQHMGKDTFLAARKQLSVMKRKGKKKKDFAAWASSHWAFHMALYKPSRQLLTLEIVRRLMQHSERFMALEIAVMDAADKDLSEHEEILKLCEDREFDQAAILLEQHIVRTPGVIDSMS